MNDRYWSVDEVSGYLGVKRDTVYKWIDRRGLPAHKVGRLWKFRKQEVDDWVSPSRLTDAAAAATHKGGGQEKRKRA